MSTPAERIRINSARCNLCGDVLVSKTRHDFRTCACGNLSVDGGHDYCKRSIHGQGTSYTELTDFGPIVGKK